MKLPLLMLLFLISRSSFSQELVANGSFEEYTACPDGLLQIDHAIGWMSFQQSPDYYNECSSSYYADVPDNWLGHQNAATGNAYTGIITMFAVGGVFTNAREFLASELTQTLEIGVTYQVSLKASWGMNDSFAINLVTNHLGIRFTSVLYSEAQPLEADNYSQIDNPFIITDTSNWVTVAGTFVADSDYKYIVIGNFYQDDQTDTLQLGPEPYGGGMAYYFIDDVSVTKQVEDQVYQVSKSLQPILFPNPANQFLNVNLNGCIIRQAEIFSHEGNSLSLKRLKTNNQSILFNTDDLPRGVYILKLDGPEKEWIIHFVIQH